MSYYLALVPFIIMVSLCLACFNEQVMILSFRYSAFGSWLFMARSWYSVPGSNFIARHYLT